MEKYVSLLRGINVGGHKKVPMAVLRKLLEKHGFNNVKTLLASGNVVYECEPEKVDEIRGILENGFGFTIPVITLPFDAINKLVGSDPFKGIDVTPKTRLYVTLLKQKSKSKLKIPYSTENGSFKILKVTDTAIFSVVDLEKTSTLDAMAFLEKEFGKELTTRNFNTVLKIAKQ